MVKRFLPLGRNLLIVYLLCLMGGCMFQEKLIFFPEKLSRDFSFQVEGGAREIFLKTSAGNEIHALFYGTNSARFAVLYFHGNAGSLRSWQYVAPDFTSRGLDLLLVDYHGYGKSTGKFSEAGFYADGEAAYQFLIEQGYSPDRIIVYGRSVGTGIAVDVASKKEIGALILESPFSSLLQLGKEKYPFLFPSLWARYRFDNVSKARDLKAPVLILHGGRDQLIPLAHSERLYPAIPSRKELVIIPRGGHNDLGEHQEYHHALDAFVAKLK